MLCKQCNAHLDDYDIGIYRKLMDKAAEQCLCRDCLGKELGWTRDYLNSLISEYRKRGCTMFPKWEETP